MLKLAGELIEGQLADHIASLDAHTRDIFELIRTGTYAPSPLQATYRGTSELTLVADKLYAFAYPVIRPRTPDKLVFGVYIAAAGKKIRIGVYADNGNCYPGARISNGAEVDVGTTGLKTLDYTTQLAKGIYWIAIISDGTPKIYATRDHLGISGDTANAYEAIATWTKADTYGDLPDPFPSGGALETRLACVGFRLVSND